tara:strand:- start:77 stop:478 length:402 start_codon:yes stop_codon:yes gene_type:complete
MQLIDHIDKIARDKGRGVLFIHFDRKVFLGYEYEDWDIRNQLIEWFENNGIAVYPCAHFASENGFESYRGQLYVDVPYVESDPDFQNVRDYLEYPDGNSRYHGVLFCYLSLDLAMKNKHHDEPGFWDRWADNF